METGNHFKNGAKPKSHTSREKFNKIKKMKNKSDYICSTIRFVSSNDTKIKEFKMNLKEKAIDAVKGISTKISNAITPKVMRVAGYIVVIFGTIVMVFSCKGNDVIDNAEAFNAQANKLRGRIATVKTKISPLAFNGALEKSAKDLNRFPLGDIIDTAYTCIPAGEALMLDLGQYMSAEALEAVKNMITEATTTTKTPQK